MDMEWISVNDKMPEPYKCVIVAFDDLTGKVVDMDFATEANIFVQHKGIVTHWMPLPDPPEA